MAKADQGDAGPKVPTASPADDEGFLGRWSRRKGEAQAVDDRALVDVQDEQAAGLTETGPEQVDQEPEAFDPATLPDIDKMEAGSDFSVFMQAGVPRELKTKALRKLWRVKPELANLDGLIDYGEDLTGSFKVVDHLKTAYEVGKGFLKDDKPLPNEIPSEAEDEATEEGQAITRDEAKPEDIGQMVEGDDAQMRSARNDELSDKSSKG